MRIWICIRRISYSRISNIMQIAILIYNLTKCGAAVKEPLRPSEQCTLRNGNKNKIAYPYLTPSRTQVALPFHSSGLYPGTTFFNINTFFA